MSRTFGILREERARWCLGAVAVATLVLGGIGGCGREDTTSDARTTDTIAAERPARAPASRPFAESQAAGSPLPAAAATDTAGDSSVNSVASPPREVTYEEAESAYRGKEYALATELFTAYVGRRPENPWGYYMLGLSAWKAGRADVAEGAFGRALEIDRSHQKSRLNLGRLLVENDRAEEALAQVEKALETDPSSAEAHRVRGRALSELGRMEQAIDSYRLALTLDGTDVWSMNNLGLLLIREGRFADALPVLARATELEGDVPVFQNNLGVVLEGLGHVDEAARVFEAALAQDAAYEKAAISLARVQALEEDPGLGVMDVSQAASDFPAIVASWRRELSEFAGGNTDVSEGTASGSPTVAEREISMAEDH